MEGRPPRAPWYYNVTVYSVSGASLCNAKHASHKKSPEGGLTARGYAGSMNSRLGIKLGDHVSITDNGDNSKILIRCDIAAHALPGQPVVFV